MRPFAKFVVADAHARERAVGNGKTGAERRCAGKVVRGRAHAPVPFRIVLHEVGVGEGLRGEETAGACQLHRRLAAESRAIERRAIAHIDREPVLEVAPEHADEAPFGHEAVVQAQRAVVEERKRSERRVLRAHALDSRRADLQHAAL